MKVWELRERLVGVDDDRVVVIVHQPMLEDQTDLIDPDRCNFDGDCPHAVDFHQKSFIGSLPVFALSKKELI